MIRTDNPVRDAEAYQAEQEFSHHTHCEICEITIDTGDEYYDFPDMRICIDCLSDYAKDYKKTFR